jgi:hypothetical protein
MALTVYPITCTTAVTAFRDPQCMRGVQCDPAFPVVRPLQALPQHPPGVGAVVAEVRLSRELRPREIRLAGLIRLQGTAVQARSAAVQRRGQKRYSKRLSSSTMRRHQEVEQVWRSMGAIGSACQEEVGQDSGYEAWFEPSGVLVKPSCISSAGGLSARGACQQVSKLFRHWYNPHICDIKTTDGCFCVCPRHTTSKGPWPPGAPGSSTHHLPGHVVY